MTNTETPLAPLDNGYLLTKVTINGKDYHAWDMPDKGWWIYPHQNVKVIVDDLERDALFRLEYSIKKGDIL